MQELQMIAKTSIVITTPKAQPYPASVIKVGAVLYSVLAYTDEESGKTTTEYEEWVVRSIKTKRGSLSRLGSKLFASGDVEKCVNLTLKLEHVTWLKRAGKTGWATSISSHFTKQFKVGEDLPSGLYTTQRAALVFQIASHHDTNLLYDKWIAEESDAAVLSRLRTDKTSHQAEMKALAIRFKKGWPAKLTTTKVLNPRT
jgi:hypothetical protein